MTVSGDFGDVDVKEYDGDADPITVVTFRTVGYLTNPVVMMFFDKKHIDRLHTLRPGDWIEVAGEIAKVQPLKLVLHHCELLEVGVRPEGLAP
jgi:hypothetical protein